MKILITNIVTLNAGDAAILYAMIDVLRGAFGDNTDFIVYDKHGDLPSRYYRDIEFRKLLYLTRESNSLNRNEVGRRLDALRFKLGLWSIKHGIPLVDKLFLNGTELRDLLEYKTADLIVSSGGTYLVENYSLTARVFDYLISLYFDRPLVFLLSRWGPSPTQQTARHCSQSLIMRSLSLFATSSRCKICSSLALRLRACI